MNRQVIQTILCCFLALLPAACARQKHVLLAAETYWLDIIDLDPAFNRVLDEESHRVPFSLSRLPLDRGVNYAEKLKRVLTDAPSDLVITGPLMSGEVIKVAPQFPAATFAVMEMPRVESEIPANVIPLRCRRESAFFEAGKLCGAALSSGRHPELGSKVGVIASGLTALEKEELAEFERGFSREMDAAQIITETIGSVVDRTKAVTAVENLSNRDVRVFLVKAYGLSAACLEKINANDGFFIMEDFPAFNLFPEKCLISIEDDYTQALHTLLTAPGFRASPPPQGQARAQAGPLLTQN